MTRASTEPRVDHIRALADRHGVHRRTVRQALASATPPAWKVPERDRPVMGPYEDLVRGWLRADREAPKKQWHTAGGCGSGWCRRKVLGWRSPRSETSSGR